MSVPTILVTTPTGNVGSRLVRLLIQAGVRPRVLCRDPSRLDPAVAERVDVVVGSQLDGEAVSSAIDGTDTVYWVSPEVFTAADPLADLRTMADHLAAAVSTHRTPRVVFQSSIGAEQREGAGLIDGLGYAETGLDALVQAQGLDVLHLRCGYFFTNLLGSLDGLRAGRLTTTQSADAALPWVDPRDIAEVAAVRLLSPAWSGRVVQAVHGPVDLTVAQVAEILGQVLGGPLELVVGTDDDARTDIIAAGLSPAAADGIVEMTSGLRDFTPEQVRDVLTTTPTTLAAWASAVLRPALE